MEIVNLIFLMSVVVLVVLIIKTIRAILTIKKTSNVNVATYEQNNFKNPLNLMMAKDGIYMRHCKQMLMMHSVFLAFILFMAWVLNIG
ncbi:hypothetical protein EDF88_4579 [Buttiauxella sp. BIGb0552]|uniref:hypothetical protein n=1 Tax=Buttiauxella sp. BIGb0552 TaxID=2485120 RepID=UPI001066B0AF|nr:hypothetical protein [Buttiauxella sp. BIGb0552]TDX11981.1 hypothetical protein EDF88_4579 [Buttiauxella sp. BIGb0552]